MFEEHFVERCIFVEHALATRIDDRGAAQHAEALRVPRLWNRGAAKAEAVLSIERQRAQHRSGLDGDRQRHAGGAEAPQSELEEALRTRGVSECVAVPGGERPRALGEVGHASFELRRREIDQTLAALQRLKEGVELCQQRRELASRPLLELHGHARAAGIDQPLYEDAEQIGAVLGHREAQTTAGLLRVALDEVNEGRRQVPGHRTTVLVVNCLESACVLEHRDPRPSAEALGLVGRQLTPLGKMLE